jgi:hypothetical protein
MLAGDTGVEIRTIRSVRRHDIGGVRRVPLSRTCVIGED